MKRQLPWKKRDRAVMYSIFYGGSKNRARAVFFSNKQNRRMHARAAKKEFNRLWDLSEAELGKIY